MPLSIMILSIMTFGIMTFDIIDSGRLNLAQKYYTRVEVNDYSKQSSLFHYSNKCRYKKFYSTGLQRDRIFLCCKPELE
jgi:hypothetical protein